jgi:hypothetical protein
MILTKQIVKSILNIPQTNTDYDRAITTLIPIVKMWVVNKCHNHFEVERKYPSDYFTVSPFLINTLQGTYISLYANTISFTASTKKISDSDGNMLNAGFRPGFDIRVQDSQNNDKIFGISSVTDNDITLSSDETLIDESSGYYTLLSLVQFPAGIEIPMSKIIGEELKNDSVINGDRVQSESIANVSFNYGATLSGEYPPHIINQLKPFMRVKFA